MRASVTLPAIWIRGAIVAGLLVVGACGGEDQPETPVGPAPVEDPTAVDPPTPDGGESSAPEAKPTAAADPCAVPEGSLLGDAAAGAKTYQTTCIACHGETPPPMQPQPVNHSDCAYMDGLSDEHLYKVICGGGQAVGKAVTMPPWGQMLGPDQIRDVVAHLRSLCQG